MESDPHSPGTERVNKEELVFKGLDSGFTIGTAGAIDTGTGRSFTFQFAHLSEVGFWGAAHDHALGVLEAVPDAAGTEIVMESTANGVGGYWYNVCMAALRHESEYELIFYPWFDFSEYRREPPAEWKPPDAFREVMETHALQRDQIYWAWDKNRSIGMADQLSPDELCWKFQQEYPATPMEAFRASRRGGYISPSIVTKAIVATHFQTDYHIPLVLGCDFATGGGGDVQETSSDKSGTGDDNVFMSRRGRIAGHELFTRFKDRNTVSVADKLGRAITLLSPRAVFMDVGGGGAQVHDILARRGFRNLILVDFGSGADDKRKYRNKRAEIYGRLRDWLSATGGADLIADEGLESELTVIRVKDENHGMVLESKKILKKEYGFSTDASDALATTFAADIPPERTDIKEPGIGAYDPVGGY